MTIPLTNLDFFEIFELAPKFELDLSVLESHYRSLQRQVHPDKTAHLGHAERYLSIQWATLANEAYQTLKKPIDRASYLLRIHGIETIDEKHSSQLSQEFLIEQMEWRDELQDVIQNRDMIGLKKLDRQIKSELEGNIDLLGNLLDVDQKFMVAADIVRQMRFLERLLAEINNAFELLEN